MAALQLQERFETLLDEHKKIIYKISNSYCSNPHDRDDLEQEIVTQLWRSFESFDERYRFSTWIYRVALNVAISFYRRESTRVRHLVPVDEHLLEAIDTRGSEPEEMLLLKQFIAELDSLNKALILLYLDGYSYREMAPILGISETNVATKISRLKNTMKKTILSAKTE